MADETTETPTPAPEEIKVPEGYVSKTELEHALADLQKFKTRANELEGKAKKEEEARLRETENWKKLYELKTQESEEKDQKLNQIQESIVENAKFSAVKEAALKSGIRPEALGDLSLIGFKDVAIETTSNGNVVVLGADRFVEQLKTIRPHWFGKPAINLNGNLPGVKGAGAIANESDLIKLSLEAQRSGDYTAYEKKLKEYKQQKRGV
jgi:hypothetical protein